MYFKLILLCIEHRSIQIVTIMDNLVSSIKRKQFTPPGNCPLRSAAVHVSDGGRMIHFVFVACSPHLWCLRIVLGPCDPQLPEPLVSTHCSSDDVFVS